MICLEIVCWLIPLVKVPVGLQFVSALVYCWIDYNYDIPSQMLKYLMPYIEANT